MKRYCDKCNKLFPSTEYMNEIELEELKELGHFTCTDCIQKEMNEEAKE